MMLTKVASRVKAILYKVTLKNTTISIISNNCWGGFMSQYMGVRYHSPFVGLYLYAPDYIRLLKNIDVIYNPVEFISKEQSRYSNLPEKNYVIGKLTNDIEIHFLHYSTEKEALHKWNKRLKRLDFNNLIVKFCDRDGCTEEHIKQFDELPYRNKVCFTTKAYPQYNSVCQIKEQENFKCVENVWECSNRYWNVILKANEIGEYKNGIITILLCKIAEILPTD